VEGNISGLHLNTESVSEKTAFLALINNKRVLRALDCSSETPSLVI